MTDAPPPPHPAAGPPPERQATPDEKRATARMHAMTGMPPEVRALLEQGGAEAAVIERALAALSGAATEVDAAAEIPLQANSYAGIAQRDPSFDDHLFTARARDSFLVFYTSWGDPTAARGMLSPPLARQVLWHMDHLAQRGRRRLLKELSVDVVRIDRWRSASDDDWDTILVHFHARAADQEVDARAKRRSGDKVPRTFQEEWVFQRAASARGRAAAGRPLDRACPNCGWQLIVDDAGACGYCRAPVMWGAYDWVVTSIQRLSDASA